MKLLLLHCDYVKYRDVRPADRPISIKSMARRAEVKERTNVLLILVTVVEGDQLNLALVNAERELEKHTKMLGNPPIIIMPFAHLSANLASPDVARNVLKKFATSAKVMDVELTSFGFHKKLELRIKAHPGSVAFRHF